MKRCKRNIFGLSCTWTVELMCTLLLTFPVSAAKREPDNAALLYYQAFLVCPDRDDIPLDVRGVFRRPSGGDVTSLRKYTNEHLHVVQLLETASNIPDCNMTVPWSQPDAAREIEQKLTSKLVSSGVLIGANVRVLAADGDYKTALSQSLMLSRMTWDIVNDHFPAFNEDFLASMDRASLQCVQAVLEVMPPDEKILRWLSVQLAAAPQISDVLTKTIRQRFDNSLVRLKKYGSDGLFPKIRQKFAEKSTTEVQKRKALTLTDDEIIELIREPYEKFLKSVIDTLNRKMSYEQQYAILENLKKEYNEQADGNPAINFPLQISADSIMNSYNAQVSNTRWHNAFGAAVDIYLYKATNGQLPQALSEDLPKDPLTGKNFLYKKTSDGFVLSSPSKFKNWSEFKFKETRNTKY